MSPSQTVRADREALVAGLIEAGRDFDRRGWALGTSGNFSVVLGRDPLGLLMTGSGLDKGRLGPEHFLVVGGDGRAAEETGLRPSAEALLHVALAKRGAGAVLHTHSVAATVLGERHLGEGALRISGYEMLKGLSGFATHEAEAAVEIFPNTQDIVSLAAEVGTRLDRAKEPRCPGFLIAGHGLYAWGSTLAEACRHVEVLEFLFEVVLRRSMLLPPA